MTKIDIVSGFLGAGKTTLIKKLLKEALAGTQTVQMCIRDRRRTDSCKQRGTGGKLIACVGIGAERRNHTPVAVSYTHLDVYKRQCPRSVKRRLPSC